MKRKISFVIAFILSFVLGVSYIYAMSYDDLVEELNGLKKRKLNSLDIRVTQIGQSVLGNPIYLLKIEPRVKQKKVIKIMIISQQHGNEPAGTEAIISFLSDLIKDDKKTIKKKYNLKGCELLIIPMVNPDGAMHNSRNNANDRNINRDWNSKSQLETQAVYKVFLDYEPEIFIDLHEFNSYSYRSDFDMTYYPGVADSSPKELKKLHHNIEEKVDDNIEEKRFPFERMSPRIQSWSKGDTRLASTYFTVEHLAIGYTVETKGMYAQVPIPPIEERIKMHRTFFETVIKYAVQNKDEIVDTITKLRSGKETAESKEILGK